MATLTYTVGKNLAVTQIEVLDPVEGGATGKSNMHAKELMGNIAALWLCIPSGDQIVGHNQAGPVFPGGVAEGGKTYRLVSASSNSAIPIGTASNVAYTPGCTITFENLATSGTFWVKITTTGSVIDDAGTMRSEYVIHPGETVRFVKKYDGNTSAYVWHVEAPMSGNHYRQAGRIVMLPRSAVTAGNLWLTGIYPCGGALLTDNIGANELVGPFPRLFAAIGRSIGGTAPQFQVPNIPSLVTGGQTYDYYITY